MVWKEERPVLSQVAEKLTGAIKSDPDRTSQPPLLWRVLHVKLAGMIVYNHFWLTCLLHSCTYFYHIINFANLGVVENKPIQVISCFCVSVQASKGSFYVSKIVFTQRT